MTVLRLRGVWYRYPGGDWVLRGVSLEAPRGVTLLAGPTGGGKSTILRVAAGLATRIYGGELKGEVEALGKPMLVPQDYDLFILSLTPREELEYCFESSGLPPWEARREAVRLAEELGIEDLLDRRVSRLSAGERQRVAIASALALGAEVLLLDEPLAYQDPVGVGRLLGLLQRLELEGVVVAEHRVHYLLPIARSIYLVAEGRARPLGREEAGQVLAEVLEPGLGGVESCTRGCSKG
ncbi:ABC transporter ATP-binding protein [Aeropyrum camini]|uniref:ABC transporter ATP-binding protein n=1 Tax=Aeropyrum camini TaxID=229980 RepID=UPI000788ACB5|nr:ABC transporter ATP-binding protein [Aeropyrum camini]